jgi:deoxyribonuclease V
MNFTENFYKLVMQIPKGKVSTYGELAKALGDIRASRAVGRMLNANPYAPIVPCHRVVMSDGSIGGFGGGVEKKKKFLDREAVSVSEDMIVDFNSILFNNFKSNFPLKSMREEQNRLREQIVLEDDFHTIKTVAGVDVAYHKMGFGACTLFDYENLNLVASLTVQMKVNMPYIPTYLAFRELPIIDALINKMQNPPTLLLIDGNGVLHPYGMGIASHVGVKLNIPTIGVAKNLLCGTVLDEVDSVGDYSEIEYEGNVVGYALKSSTRSKKPIYISPGHKVSFKTSLEVVKRFCAHKIPEPIREAHGLATRTRDSARR